MAAIMNDKTDVPMHSLLRLPVRFQRIATATVLAIALALLALASPTPALAGQEAMAPAHIA
jgi:hypothetical protein